MYTKFLAEFLGTACLLYFGCMTALNESSNFVVSIAFGLVVMMAVMTFGAASGGHINPCVSLAAYLYGTLTFPMMLVYVVGQFAGALCGYALLMRLAPIELFMSPLASGGHCVSTPAINMPLDNAFGVEVCLTGFLVWCNCGAWDPRNRRDTDAFPIKLAFVVAGLSIAGGPVSGASMNPARSLAPAIWHGRYEHLWLYFAGPLTGTLLVTLLYRYVFWRTAPKDFDVSESLSSPSPL